jgi:predicted CXXCH cytochrome family protein
MKTSRRSSVRIAGAALFTIGAALATLVPLAVRGGDWHRTSTLRCSDCHTMHNSAGGQPMRYDLDAAPAPALLRAADGTALCLACHGSRGPSPTAPSVMSPTNFDPPGGGFPSELTDPLGHAHSLGIGTVTPPYGSTPVNMSCGACHDVHGNTAYRNLRPGPSGRGTAIVAPTVRQIILANGSNPDQVYLRSNVSYQAGGSQWCVDCHDQITTAHVAGAGSSLAAHPWDRSIGGGALTGVTDLAWWMGSIPNRVPVQNPLVPTPPADTDQVFCLSCHKAHGSPNPAALIYADGLTLTSTCQQCHNQ